MNKRLFVVTGAMLCAVITYASVMAVKNRAARKTVAPNAAPQPVKQPKNGEVVAVSTSATSASSTMQLGVGPTNSNVPEEVAYWFLFRQQTFINKKAAEVERQGKDSSFLRKYYQNEANLDDRQAAILNEIATQCDLEVRALEAEAKVVVDRLRAERAKAPVNQNEKPKPSPELQVLQQRIDNVVRQARNQLERAMGPASFNAFQSFVRDKVASQIQPRSTDTLKSVGRDSADRQPRGKKPQQ